VLGLFGLVGGAWGLAAALYASLFGNKLQFFLKKIIQLWLIFIIIIIIIFYLYIGVERIAPWGFVQDHCCRCCGIHHRTHNKLKKTLPTIPLINSSLRVESNSFKMLRITKSFKCT